MDSGNYGVGDSAPRKEDARLLTGRGAYTDDINLPNQAHGYFLRSDVPSGAIRAVDTEVAKTMPGVLGIYTAADLDAEGYGALLCRLPLKSRDDSPLKVPPRPALAGERVRYVGEGIAFVVAETLDAARDAAEAIEVDIEPEDVVADAELALENGALLVHNDVPANVCLDWEFGDEKAVEKAFVEAAHVTRIRLENQRVHSVPMEPRAAVANFNAKDGRFEIHTGAQGAFGMSRGLGGIMMPGSDDNVHVFVGDVGGSFGMKAQPYAEYITALHAARALGRPVKWRNDRSGSFLSDQAGRDSVTTAELALDADGNFLAVRTSTVGNMGAYLSGMGPQVPTVNIMKNLPGPYRTPAIYTEAKCVFTNTVPTGPYRGAGRPEGVYIMERLIDAAARETGQDPATLRRRNLIPAEAMPYTAPSGQPYDSGEFAAILDEALAAADWDGFETRRAESEVAGKLRGRGLSCYLEVTAPQGKEMGGLRFGADGRVTFVTGTLDYGQGHRSAYAQVIADKLGVPFDSIDLLQGDSDQLLTGGGTGGSRSIMASGKAALDAADEVIVKGRALAGYLLEAAEDDIEFADGSFRVAGTDRAIGLFELAERVRTEAKLPDGLPDSLDSELVSETPPSAFPNGCHVCEVEVDPDTGRVVVERFVAIDDFGTLINPMLVDGQVHGGIVQGIGQALMEHSVYDADGQPLAGTFMDYAMPRAADFPSFDVAYHPVPATTNPLGAKGCGEAGTTGATPAVMNALTDALASAGAEAVGMPASPERVWRALADARAA